MSFRVLVVPEDPTLNGHILKPLVEALLGDAGRPRARVKVLDNPRVQGYDHAVRTIRGDELHASYAFFDLWMFIPDADRGKRDAMDRLEADSGSREVPLLCCPARPEVEIYACVPFRDELDMEWKEVRNHLRMREEVFEPLLARHGDARRPGGGRDMMITRSLRNLPLLYRLCPETKRLRDRIAAHLEAR